MTTSDIKATTFLFLHVTLTPISGRPNYTTVSMLKRQLYANAYSNTCARGGGLYGYLGLVMPAAEYCELEDAVAWTLPPAPEAAAASDDDKKKHKQLLVDIRAMDACLKKQLLAAVEHVYLLDINKELTGFDTCTAAGILDYLTTKYTIIDYDDLQANRKKLDEPWDLTEPIQFLWNRIDTCQRFAKAGGSEIPDSTAIAATYNVLLKTGAFPSHTAFWCHKPSAERTMIAFRKLFEDADRQRDSANNASSANVCRDIPTTAKSTSTGKKNASKYPQYLSYGDLKIWYCWSHGGCTSEKHTSKTCTRAKPGHVRHATWYNMCGGSGAMNWSPLNRNFKSKTTSQTVGST